MKNNKAHFASCLFKVPIFNHLNSEEQEGIIKLVNVVKLTKGQTLYNMGEEGSSLYVVHHGKIKITKYNEEGSEQVIRILNPGEFLGEQSLFLNEKTDNFAIALEDSHICVLNGIELKKHIFENPEIGLRIINELSSRLSDAENKFESYNLDSVDKRIASSIIKLSEDRETFDLPFSKADWASMLGMTSETLSRKLSQFRKNGIIDLKGQRTLKVLDLEKLKTKINN